MLSDPSRAPLRPGDKVLVTGATSFIAGHIIDLLLKGGYVVKGTARKGSKKIDRLRKFFDSYGDKFEVVEVGGLEEEGAFDEVIRDVDAVCHVASPITLAVTDPFRDVIDPAVKGTVSLLAAAHRYGSKVKSVVVTSSVAAILHPIEAKEYIYTETDWNDQAITAFKDWKAGDALEPLKVYVASKNEAERALWRFVDEHNPSFGVSTILPSYAQGPVLQGAEGPEDLCLSLAITFSYFMGKHAEVANPPGVHCFVDVRDVALAHVRALERPEVSAGQRFITSNDKFSWQQLVDVLRQTCPERASAIPPGEPGTNYPTRSVTISGKKAAELLGIQYRGLEETLHDTCETFKALI